MKQSRLLCTVFSYAIILSPFQAFAVDKYWSCSSDFWTNDGCWSPTSQPISGDNVFLTQSDSSDRVVTYANATSPTPELSSLTVDATGGGTMTLSQNQDLIKVQGAGYIGSNGTGIYNQSGGSSEIGSFYVGVTSTGSIGTYNMSDGYLFASSARIGINGAINQTGGSFNTDNGLRVDGSYDLSNGTYTAFEGNVQVYGTFTQSGGEVVMGGGGGGIRIHNEYNLIAGNLSTATESTLDGTLYQTGGVFEPGLAFYIGGNPFAGAPDVIANGIYNLSNGIYNGGVQLIGYDGTGTINQSGGTNTVTNALYLGYNSTATGIYNLSDGVLNGDSFPDQYIGYNGTGTFTQSGGSNSTGTLRLGYNSTADGTYNLINGHLASGIVQVGISGTGAFNQSGGTFSPDNEFYIGSGGTYNLSDGSSSMLETAVLISGAVNQTGGTLTHGGYGFNLVGEYNLNVGDLSSYSIETISGTFNQSGGNHVNDDLIIHEAAVNIDGTYNLMGGALDAVNIMVNSGGSFNFDGGTLSVDNFTGDLINNGGTLEPGDSPGLTNIFGNYGQSSDGTYAVEIGGTESGEFDVLDVTGTATLAGILDVELFDLGSGLFNPELGDTFDILLAETINGEFDILSLAGLGNGFGWDVSYILNDIGTDIVRLSVQAVPIPASVWLFGSGLFGLVGIARRNKA